MLWCGSKRKHAGSCLAAENHNNILAPLKDLKINGLSLCKIFTNFLEFMCTIQQYIGSGKQRHREGFPGGSGNPLNFWTNY